MKSIIKKLKHQCDVMKQNSLILEKEGRVALVLGNSPRLNDICPRKLDYFTSNNKVDLYVCNSFFAECILDLKKFHQINFFAADPVILDYYFHTKEKKSFSNFVNSLKSNQRLSSANIDTQIATSLKFDLLSFQNVLRDENINLFVSYHPNLSQLPRGYSLIPNLGVYMFPQFIARLLYRIPASFMSLPLIGPSAVKLMINHAVYSNYDRVFAVGDHDTDLSQLRGDRENWERPYNYFYEETNDRYLKGEAPYGNYLRKFLTETLDETYLPEKFHRIEYLASNHFKLAFPSFGTIDLMRDM